MTGGATGPAHVVSTAGNMTLRQAGLAGLVSPQSADAGVMNARLGRAVLDGAAVDTLDMYGDGLVALNVTRQVTQVRVGQHSVPGLVTNSGTVLAPGGTVALSAQAADGLVSSLVSGTVKSGSRVLASGIGGDIEVAIPTPTSTTLIKRALGGVSHPPSCDARCGVTTSRVSVGGAQPAKAAARQAVSARRVGTRSTLDETGTLTVADSCTGISDCLLFSTFLNAGSTIVDNNGAIIFAPGTLAPSQTLTSGNAIVLTTTVGAHSHATGDIIFDNGLSVLAPTYTINAAGSVLLNGVIAGVGAPATTVQVTAAGAITEHMPGSQLLGSIDAVALTVSAGGSVALDNAANTIGTLAGGGASTGSFTFADGNGLSVTAPVSAGGAVSITVTGTGNGLTSSAAMSGSSVALSAATLDIGGAVTTPVLAAQATAGSADFTSGANMIGSVGTLGTVSGVQATAGISLADAESLVLNSPVSSPNQTVGIALTGNASSLTGTGAITARELDLSATGSMALTGAVTATLLTADATGGIALTSNANDIAAIGTDPAFSGLVAGGNITVSDAAALTLNALVAAPGQTVALNVTGSGNALSGAGAINGGAVALSAGGSIALTGTIAAATLAAQAGDGITLSTNNIGSIGSAGTLVGVRAGGDITLGGDAALALDAGIASTGGNVLLTLTGSASSLTGTGGIAGTDVALSIGGSIAVSGPISATVLAAAAGGAIVLNGAQNLITEIGPAGTLIGLTANGALTLDDASTLAIAAPVMATGGDVAIGVTGAGDTLFTSAAITGNTIVLSATAGMDLGASVDAGTFALSLAGGTGGVAAGGALTAGTLAASAGGGILLNAGDNGITSIGSAGGLTGLRGASVTLVDAPGLTVDAGAAVTATGGGVSITIGHGTLSLAGSIVTGGLAALSVTGGDIVETGLGLISAGTLTAGAAEGGGGGVNRSAGGAVTLGGANTITALGDSSAAGNFLLADGAVTILPGATVSGASGVTFTLGGNAATQQAGSLLASSGGAVTVNGGLVQLGGTLTALDAATVTGGVAQSAGASIAGRMVAISGARLSQDDSTITGTRSVSISLSGSLTQSGGGSIGGGTIGIVAQSLSQDDSAIAGGTGGVTIGLTGDLAQTATGAIASQGNLVITSNAGTLNLGGTAATAASGNLTLAATAGAITETALGGGSATGTIMTGTLTGMAGGQTLLDTASSASAGNQIAGLAGFRSDGAFSLVDGAAALTIQGTLGAPTVVLRVPSLIVGSAGAIEAATGGTVSVAADAYSLAGTVSAPGGLVALGLLHEGAFTVAPGGTLDRASLLHVLASGGTIALGTTDGLAADGTNGLGSGGTWDAGTSGSVTSLSITGAVSLTANAAVLGLFSTGKVAVDGVLSVGTLVGAAGGDFLAGSANAIDDIGTLGLTAGGSLLLTDANGLLLDAGSAAGTTQLSGANGVTLTLNGRTLTQGGDTSIGSSAGAVVIDAGLLVQDPQAALTAGTNVSITGAVTQLGPDSIVAEAGDVRSGAVQQDGGGLIRAAAGNLTIQGSATQTASTLAAPGGAVTLDGALIQTGSVLSAGTNAAINAGQLGTGIVLTQTGDSLVSAGGILTVDGAVMQQASSLSGTGAVMIGGGLTQTDGALVTGGMVTVDGTVSQQASSLSGSGAVMIGGSVAQTEAATITGSLVTIGASSPAGTLSQAGGSSITATQLLAVSLSGDLTQDSTSALVSTAGSVSLSSTGGGLLIAGTVSAVGGQVMLTTGDGIITQAASGAGASGTLQAASLSAMAGTLGAGSADLLLNAATANAFGTIAAATATGTVNLNDTAGATLAGRDVISGAQGVTLTLGGNSLTQDGLSVIESSAGTVVITAAALMQQGGATVTAESGFSLSGNVTQGGMSSITASTGMLAIGGNAVQRGESTLAAEDGSLTISGSLTQSLSTASALFDVATGGAVTQAGGTIVAGQDVLLGTLAGAGGSAATVLTQSAGSAISAGNVTLFGAAAQDASSVTGTTAATILGGLAQSDGAALTGGAVSIGTGLLPATLTQDGSVITANSGNLVIALTGYLTQTATGSIVSQDGNVTIHSSGGTLFLAGQDQATAGVMELVALNGDITEAAQTGGAATGNIQALALAAQAGTLGGAAHAVLLDTVGGNAIGTITGVAGTTASGASGLFELTDQSPLSLAAGVTVTGDAGVRVTLAPSLQLTQQANSAIVSPALVQLVAGEVAQDDGVLIAGAGGVTISGGLTQFGSDTVGSSGGNIAIAGSVTQTASTIQAVSGAVSIGGTASQVSGMVLAGQDVSLGGLLYPAGTTGLVLTQGQSSLVSAGVSVTIAGGVAQDASSVTASGGLTIDAGVAQADASVLSGARVTIGVSGLAGTVSQAASSIIATDGGLTISLTGDLTQDGTSRVASPDGNVSIISAGGGIYLAGVTEAPAGTVMLAAPLGTVTETALGAGSATGTILAGTLAAQAGYDSAFDLLLDTAGANRIGTITSATATGILDIADGGSLTLAASGVIAGDQGVALSVPGLTVSQDAGSSITSAAGAVAIDAALLSQAPQASIVAASGLGLTGGLTQQGATIDALAGSLTIGGPASQASDGVIEAGGGAIAIGGGLAQSGSAVSAADGITVAGSVTQTGSSLGAGGMVLLGGGALVQRSGSLLSGDAGVVLTLADGLAQDSTSAIQSSGGNVTVDATSGDIAFAGRMTAGGAGGSLAGTTTLIAAQGSILGGAGTLQTGVLAGSATGAIDVAGAANQIAAVAAQGPGLAGVSAGGTLQLNDSGALLVQDGVVSGTGGILLTLTGGLTESANSTIESLDGSMAIESPGVVSFAGKLAAPQILLGNLAAPKRIVWTGGTILTGSAIPVPGIGIVPSIANPIGPGNREYGKGLFATAGSFVQTGTTVVGGLDGARQQTVELALKGPGGTIAFDPRTGFGLLAPNTQLLLDLQISGRASGSIDVAGLNLYYFGTTPNAGSGSDLTGSVDGHTGSAAAASGFVHSLPGVNYALNNCPIEAVSCVLLSPVIVPLGNPVQDVEVSVARRHQDDDDLILPNVGEQDY